METESFHLLFLSFSSFLFHFILFCFFDFPFFSFAEKLIAVLELSCGLMAKMNSWTIYWLYLIWWDWLCFESKLENVSWSSENKEWPFGVWGGCRAAKAAQENIWFCKLMGALCLALSCPDLYNNLQGFPRAYRPPLSSPLYESTLKKKFLTCWF